MRRLIVPVLALAVLAVWTTTSLGASGVSGDKQLGGQRSPRLGTTTWHTFTTSADGGTTFRVSNEGNVYSIESPTGYEHINVGTVIEGYLLCYTPPATSEVQSKDVADSSSGFGAATHSTVAPWTVTRDTSDGKVQLKQVFTFNGLSKSLTIAMTVKNLTGSTLSNVLVDRIADFDVDVGGSSGFADFTDNWFATTNNAVFAWNDPGSFSNAHGMILRHLKQPGGTSRYSLSFVAADCHTGAFLTISQGDGNALMGYALGNISAGASKTVTIQYVRD